METFFLNLGLSYTWSKALPFIIFILLGIFVGLFLFKRSKSVVMKIVSIITIFIPFGIYFAINPIYDGDFNNTARIVERTADMSELNGTKLVVISLPGCRFCKESIPLLKEVKERHKNIEVEYVVVSSNSSDLKFYLETSKGVFPVRLAENVEAMGRIATDDQGYSRFPTFVLVNNDKKMDTWNWSTNTFGISALDKVVGSFK